MNYVIAVDGGGTKTDVICADEQGSIVGEGHSGPTSLTATNIGAASFALNEALRQATEKLPEDSHITRFVMGLAGMDTPAEAERAKATFAQIATNYGITDLTLVNDIVISLAAGSDAPNAVALISGTGSHCYGRNEQGEEVKVGGMDYLLTDQGSGYEIGRAVLRKAVKSFDGRGEKTKLEQIVCEHFKIASVAQLKDVVYNPLLTKTEIANLSKLCLQAFEENDAVARMILDHSINSMYEMVDTAMKRLNVSGKDPDFVLTGGITQIPYVKERLSEKVTSLCPRVRIVVPEQNPVYGALKLALKPRQSVSSAAPTSAASTPAV